ncbi:hypothetical protein KKA33_04430, partial [Patescibacteria group bacterium]|nr:hypothetical protein [Patescibacteria group bacterium]
MTTKTRLFRTLLMVPILLLGLAVFGLYEMIEADTFDTEAGVSNASPVINQTPADDSDATTPTNAEDDVTFTGKGIDVGSENYYMAFCSSDQVTHNGTSAPICEDADHTWAISSSTVSNTAIGSGSGITYTTTGSESSGTNGCTDDESCPWYAFVCDAVVGGSCYPANSSGDQGFALGTITFSDVPEDGDTITIDSITYEFDTAGDGISSGTEVDTALSASEQDAAYELGAVEAGTSSHMAVRGAVVYVYADAEGTGGNSIGMTEPDANEGGSTSEIVLSGTVLSGGSATGQSPFKINHASTFGTVTTTDNDDPLTDGDMEAADASAWTAGNDATLTKETGTPHGGSRVLRIAYGSSTNPYAYQNVMTSGTSYHVTGWARGDGTNRPNIQDGAAYIWTGTTSTSWQYFDFVRIWGSSIFYLQTLATGAGYSEFDDVSVVGTEINPGDTLRFTFAQADIADTDTDDTQDTINMYICTDATTAFDYSGNSCTNGSLICSDTGVDPTSTDATCDETGNTLVPATDIHSTENFKVYVEDSHDFTGTGTNAQSYDIANTAPTHDTPELDVHAPTLPNSVGYWQFEDGTSATAFDDETSNDFDGVCTNCPDWAEEGVIGGAYDFTTANSDIIDLGNDPLLRPTEEITVMAWVKSNTTDNVEVVSYRKDAPAGCYALYEIMDSSVCVDLDDGTTDGVSEDSAFNSTLPGDGTWHHVAMTYSRNDQILKSYMDGVLQTDQEATGDYPLYTEHASLDKLFVGAAQPTLRHFDGSVDELHIYDRALTTDEITAIYNAYTTPGTTAYTDSNMDISAKPITIDDHDSDTTTTIYNWEKDGSSIAVLNMPFDSNMTSTAADAVKDYSTYENNGTLAASTATPTWTNAATCGNYS